MEEGETLAPQLETGSSSGHVFYISQALQCTLILLILLVTVATNISIVLNISKSDIKKHMVSFVLIKNLCIVDAVGALLILPWPLAATFKGEWDFNHTFCTANSIINIGIWLEHLIMFALLKVDKVLASCLPYGQYPLLPPHRVTVICRLSWVISFAISITVNTKYSCSYEPAVVLCIPVLPLGFFVFASSLVCLIIIIIVVGFLGSIIYLKKKQAQILEAEMAVSRLDYKGMERAAVSSFLTTMSHILLYVPTMLVVGLHGWILPPGAILVCDMFVYSEFLMHPLLLLVTSNKLRTEICQAATERIKELISSPPQLSFSCCAWWQARCKKKLLSPPACRAAPASPPALRPLEEAATPTISLPARPSYPEYRPVPSESPSISSAAPSQSPPRLDGTGPAVRSVGEGEGGQGGLLGGPGGGAGGLGGGAGGPGCSWPSVGTPSVASFNTRHSGCSENSGCRDKRESGLCDSGYSELDTCSCASTNCATCNAQIQDLPVLDKQTQTDYCGLRATFRPGQGEASDELELCFTLDRIVETSDEEKCFQDMGDILASPLLAAATRLSSPWPRGLSSQPASKKYQVTIARQESGLDWHGLDRREDGGLDSQDVMENGLDIMGNGLDSFEDGMDWMEDSPGLSSYPLAASEVSGMGEQNVESTREGGSGLGSPGESRQGSRQVSVRSQGPRGDGQSRRSSGSQGSLAGGRGDSVQSLQTRQRCLVRGDSHLSLPLPSPRLKHTLRRFSFPKTLLSGSAELPASVVLVENSPRTAEIFI